MKHALFLNGVYEGVLEEILKAQEKEPGITCYLQPYKDQAIKMLEKHQPSEQEPVTFYISLTSSLHLIGYTATIVGWEDKRELFKDGARIDRLNEHIKQFQPGEHEIYRFSDDEQTRECVNLIAIKNLRRLANPFSVRNLTKVSDGRPYKPRTQSGGWSEVRAVPDWADLDESAFVDVLDADLEVQVKQSMQDSAEERRARLAKAPKKPKEILVRSRGFARNPDVIAEVLQRANGVCEGCNSEAPFLRKKDNSPYLEVHHKKPLAANGHDTVDNALALCPNCHRELHFGI